MEWKIYLQPGQQKGEQLMKKQTIAITLFWVGFLIATSIAIIGTGSLMSVLRNLTREEISTTMWNLDGPLFMFWAFAVPLGAVLAVIAAFVYARTRPVFPWLTGIGVLGAVLAMNILWSRVYSPLLYGIGGVIILISFFVIVWIWLKKYAALDIQERIAGSYRLIGYLFWINASWFLCGETSKLHLKAFENDPMPIPSEIMVFLVLGWVFVLVGEYKSRQSKSA
jgi:hypothetical protein